MSSPRAARYSLCAALALAVLTLPARAQTPTNIWINSSGTGTLNWSDPTNWNIAPAAGGTPSTILQFNAVDPANYTANNDLTGTFSLLGLLLNSSSSNPVSLSGNALSFQTSGSFINQLGPGAVTISNPLTLNNTSSGNDVAIGGPGSGTITLSGLISGSGGLNVTNYGGATVVLTNGGNAFGTAGLTGGAQVSGPGATLLVTASSGTPLGTAGVEISDGTIAIAPGGSGANVQLSLSSTSGNLDLNAGGTLVLNKGANTSLTFGIRALIRTTGTGSSGNLVVVPASGIANLGTAAGESLVTGASFPQANVNGIVVPVVVAQASATDTTGDFLHYNATNSGGFVGLIQFQGYTSYGTPGGGFSSSTAGTEVSNVTAPTTASVNASVAALRVTGTTLTINSGTTVTLAGGTYSTGYNQSGIILNNATVAGGGTLALGPTEADFYVAGTSTVSAQLTSTNTGSNAPALVKFGTGTLLLTNPNNSFAAGGVFSLYGGNLAIIGPGGNNDATALGTGARGLVMRGGGFEVTGGDYAPPAGTKTFTIGTSGGTFDVEGGSTFTLAQTSQLAPVAGAGPLIKTGTGTFVIGAPYAIGGLNAVLVNQGRLQVNAATTGAPPVFVNNSGTLGGTGAVAGTVTVRPGGGVSPGTTSAIGTLTVGGAVLQPGGNYLLKYNAQATAPVPGTDNDFLTSSAGVLNLAALGPGNPFNITLAAQNVISAPTSPTQWTIATFGGGIVGPGGPLSGDVTSLFSFTGDFTGPAPTAAVSGNSLILTFTPVPEPGLILAVCAGAGGCFGLLRRRRLGARST